MRVTLNAIKKHSPCGSGWKKLLASLDKKGADDEPLKLTHILESNGLSDALWCLRALPDEMQSIIRLFNCDIAERALPHWEKQYPDDKRPHEAIAVSRQFANGDATKEQLDAAEAARSALAAARAAWAAARAAWAAVGYAAWDAARAAGAARDVAEAAAGAAGDAELEEQKKLFIKYFGSPTQGESK